MTITCFDLYRKFLMLMINLSEAIVVKSWLEDIVQFVPLKKFQHSNTSLVKETINTVLFLFEWKMLIVVKIYLRT